MRNHFKILRTIDFHETDAAGFVHFSKFFNFMEEAEHAFLQSLEIPVFEKGEDGGWAGWPHIHTACEYKSPLRFQDRIEIEIQVNKIGTKSIHYDIGIYKITENNRTKAATGELTSIYAKQNPTTGVIKTTPIPKNFLNKLLRKTWPV